MYLLSFLTIYFNPRSHEGSDAPTLFVFLCSIYFNPRSHEGSDIRGYVVSDLSGISIHAPTRGATNNMTIVLKFGLFQSTLPRGERRQPSWCRICRVRFQSTLPRGERPRTLGNMILLMYFNPRSHEGSDFNFA